MRFSASPSLAVLCLATFAAGPPVAAEPDPAAFEQEIRPLLETYCFRCHGGDDTKGDVNLVQFESADSVVHYRRVWLDVLEQLETDEMPTKGPFPTPAERERLIHWVDQAVNQIDWEKHRYAGHETIPRLTHREYDNTMRDLLGIDIHPSATFSEDGEGESGFDNDRDALFVTPAQMEKYFATASRAVAALTAHYAPAGSVSHHFESEDMFMTETGSRTTTFGDGSEGYTLTRGQMTLYESASFPVSGFYEFSVRARTSAGPTGLRLRINDIPAADFVIDDPELAVHSATIFVDAGSHQMAWNIEQLQETPAPSSTIPLREEYPPYPENISKIISTQSNANAPLLPLPGDASDELRKFATAFNRESLSVQRAYEWLRVLGPEGNPQEIIRFKNYVVDRGKAFAAVYQDAPAALGLSPEAFDQLYASHNAAQLEDRELLLAAVASITLKNLLASRGPGSPGIDWIQIRGPIEPARIPGGERVFTVRPGAGLDESAAARQVLEGFLPRAFRRPLDPSESDAYFALYETQRQAGESFDDALGLALTASLVSPHFLYRNELRPGIEGDYALNDYEIASRLSYFLWMSMPDPRLFELAAAGTLSHPDTLRAEVRRMLADPKADGFARIFTGQWLGFGPDGRGIFPDARKFRNAFNEELKQAMIDETVLVFDSLIREQRSLLELIDSRETWLNEALATHYGISGVTGPAMRPVALSDPRRGGDLGMASILTSTSTPQRTSPVVRGTWILETLLADHVPPPPPNAGELPDNAGETKNKTLRDELEQHRDREECSGCHSKIDPLGFGLENFDAIGRWRDRSPAGPIDARGTLPSGESFDGVVELKRFILEQRRDDFIRGVATHMLSFALGREVKDFDTPAVDKIVRSLDETGFNTAVLIEEVALSYPFLHQSNRPPEFP